MTYLNNDLQVRRELAERIQDLQNRLDIANKHMSNLQDTVKEYDSRITEYKDKIYSVMLNIESVCNEVPNRYRQRIRNILPVK